MIKKKNRGFTLVEVLICVGIIGIIAALTIPALLTSTSEKALEAQRKAFYSRMAQAFGQLSNLKLYKGNASTSSMLFITQGLTEVYKLANICDSSSLAECLIPEEITDYYADDHSYTFAVNDKYSLTLLNPNITTSNALGDLTANFAAFKTANGESVVMWYNPNCKSKSEVSPRNLAESVCINIVYDVNGGKTAPNAYGEDIGYLTVFYPTDSIVVAPLLYNEESFSGTHSQMLAKAASLDLMPPTLEELVSILVNANITKITADQIASDDYYWTSSYVIDDTDKVWVAGQEGIMSQDVKSASVSLPYFLVRK